MRDNRWRAFWKTWLFYVLVGPLVGFFCVLISSVVIESWGPIADRVAALLPHAPDPACVSPDPRHFDLRCYQGHEPRPFRRLPEFGFLLVVVFGAYFIGFIPAALAGLCVSAAGLYGSAGFIYALGVGAVIGLAFGSLALFHPETAIGLFLTCVIATMVCWRLTRRWWRNVKVADANSPA